MQRRTVIGGALVGLLAVPGLVMAKEKTPTDPFVLLLNGPYQPVPPGTPDLGFSKVEVDLNDGTFLTTQILPVHVEGTPCAANENTAIGKFYAPFNPPGGDVAVYQLPNGAIAMQFIQNCGSFPIAPFPSDGLGGGLLEWNLGTKDPGGDWDLSIVRTWS